MAVGLVDDAEWEAELARLESKPHVTIEPLPSRGRSDGDVNVPDSLRKIIGEDAVLNGRQSALGIAKQFDISPASVSAYAKGATSTASYNTPSKEIIQHINKSRRRAISKAQKTLNGALEAISQEKLDYADPKDLASIAKDMTVVIKNLEPPQSAVNAEGEKQPQFVIYAPQFRDERSFEVIKVDE